MLPGHPSMSLHCEARKARSSYTQATGLLHHLVCYQVSALYDEVALAATQYTHSSSIRVGKFVLTYRSERGPDHPADAPEAQVDNHAGAHSRLVAGRIAETIFAAAVIARP